MKKTFSLICVTVFLAGLFAGCNGKNAGGNRFEGDKMVISVSNWDVSQSFGSKPDELYQYIQDRFGIVFEPHDVSWDNYGTLPLLWAQSGTLPDIIGGVDFVNLPTFMDWIDAGMIKALPDDFLAYPTLNNLMNQQFVQDRAVDGQNYFIPRISSPYPEYNVIARGIINRRDWREKLGIPVPQTEEDFLNMWRAFANPANNINGSVVFGVLPNDPAYLYDQTFAGHGDTKGIWEIRPDGSVVIPALEPSSLPLMKFWRKAYKEGLVDPDFITNSTHDVSMQNFAQGRAGTLLRPIAPIHLYTLYQHWGIYNPNVDFLDSVEILMPPRLSGIIPLFLMGAGFWSETYINANVDDEKLEKILQFFDWLCSEEGINTVIFGFEGKDWERREGEIVMLTPIDPSTGQHLTARDLYQFATGGMRILTAWAEDLVQWTDPGIPIGIRNMSIGARDTMLDSDMGLTRIDNRIGILSLTVPEALRMTLNMDDEWASFITDTSSISDEDLFVRFQSRWIASGYDTAKEAMTREAAARGWTY